MRRFASISLHSKTEIELAMKLLCKPSVLAEVRSASQVSSRPTTNTDRALRKYVLSNLENIQVCTHYKYNGELIDYLPFDASNDNIEPVYKELAAWKEDLTQLSSINDAPSQLKTISIFLKKN